MIKFKKSNLIENIEVSACGIVRRIDNQKIKSQHIGSTGYYMVSIRPVKNSKTIQCKVHRLVAEAYCKNPYNYEYVNHKDGNKLNNSVNNLEWCTHLQNMQHAFSTGLANNTNEKNGMAKLTVEEVLQIKQMLKEGISQYKIASMFDNISRSAILKIHLGKTWANVQPKRTT